MTTDDLTKYAQDAQDILGDLESAQDLDYSDPQVQREVANRLGISTDGIEGCLSRGAKYGGQASRLVASVGGVDPYSQGAALLIGGLYGCSRKGGFGAVWKDVKDAWSVAERGVSRIGGWVTDLVTGDLFDRKKKNRTRRKTPATTTEAMVITRKYFERGNLKQVQASGHRWLTTAVLTDLYGPAASIWDHKRVVALWWSFWTRSLATNPDWKPSFRLYFAHSRTGHFLEKAPKSITVEDWPLHPDTRTQAQIYEQAQAQLQGQEQGAGVLVERGEPVMVPQTNTESWWRGWPALLGGFA